MGGGLLIAKLSIKSLEKKKKYESSYHQGYAFLDTMRGAGLRSLTPQKGVVPSTTTNESVFAEHRKGEGGRCIVLRGKSVPMQKHRGAPRLIIKKAWRKKTFIFKRKKGDGLFGGGEGSHSLGKLSQKRFNTQEKLAMREVSPARGQDHPGKRGRLLYLDTALNTNLEIIER